MWSTVITVFILAVIVAFVMWFVWGITHPREPAEPRDNADVPATIGRGPRSNAGAVALDEPEENEGPDSIGRKL